MRIGKCKICKSELESTAICWNTIIEVTCKQGHIFETEIVPKAQRELNSKFFTLINEA